MFRNMGLKKGEKNETNKDKQNTQNDKTEREKTFIAMWHNEWLFSSPSLYQLLASLNMQLVKALFVLEIQPCSLSKNIIIDQLSMTGTHISISSYLTFQ